jgi:hypothetical protein
MGLHRVTIHIHMFPMSHTLSKIGKHFAKLQQGKLDAYVRIFGCDHR